MELMEVKSLTKNFGGLTAVNKVDFKMKKGEILGLIGPNGAGKTTLFNCIASTYPVSSGKVYLEGQDITNLPAYKISRLGIARTFQVVQTFKKMTVAENVMVGSFTHNLNPATARREAEELLELTGLIEKKDFLGTELTIADLKRLEITRALSTKPNILLLDESMAGLNLVEVEEALVLVRKLKQSGLTILIIEHVMEALMPVADNIVVLDAGTKIAEGPPAEIINNKVVIKAYLGEGYHA